MPNFIRSQSTPDDNKLSGKLGGAANEAGSSDETSSAMNNTKNAGTQQTATNFPGQSAGFNGSQQANKSNSANTDEKNPAS